MTVEEGTGTLTQEGKIRLSGLIVWSPQRYAVYRGLRENVTQKRVQGGNYDLMGGGDNKSGRNNGWEYSQNLARLGGGEELRKTALCRKRVTYHPKRVGGSYEHALWLDSPGKLVKISFAEVKQSCLRNLQRSFDCEGCIRKAREGESKRRTLP